MPVEKFNRTVARSIYSIYQYTPYPVGHAKHGYLSVTGTDTYSELETAIKNHFKDNGLLEQGERYGLSSVFKRDEKRDQPIPSKNFRGLIAYAEEGANEGEIVTVAAIYFSDDAAFRQQLVTLWVYKAFAGLDHASQVAAILTRFFSRNG